MVNTVALHSIPPKIFCLGRCQYIAAVFIVNDMWKKREPYVLTGLRTWLLWFIIFFFFFYSVAYLLLPFALQGGSPICRMSAELCRIVSMVPSRDCNQQVVDFSSLCLYVEADFRVNWVSVLHSVFQMRGLCVLFCVSLMELYNIINAIMMECLCFLL